MHAFLRLTKRLVGREKSGYLAKRTQLKGYFFKSNWRARCGNLMALVNLNYCLTSIHLSSKQEGGYCGARSNLTLLNGHTQTRPVVIYYLIVLMDSSKSRLLAVAVDFRDKLEILNEIAAAASIRCWPPPTDVRKVNEDEFNGSGGSLNLGCLTVFI